MLGQIDQAFFLGGMKTELCLLSLVIIVGVAIILYQVSSDSQV